jgi:small subunit ribosomal protein S20
MANSKSAKKRINIASRNCLQNKYYKTSVQTLVKTFFRNLEDYKISKSKEKKKDLKQTLNLVYSFLDKGTKKKIFHKNTASRKKARLAMYLKQV